jgi:hypothetical protein
VCVRLSTKGEGIRKINACTISADWCYGALVANGVESRLGGFSGSPIRSDDRICAFNEPASELVGAIRREVLHRSIVVLGIQRPSKLHRVLNHCDERRGSPTPGQ